MKKLLFAFGTIAAMLIISSCSSESLDDAKNENSINKRKISPSTITNTMHLDSISQINNESVDGESEEPIDGGDPIKP